MTVRLLYFASFRDAAGCREEVRELPAGATVQILWQQIQQGGAFFASLPAMPPAAVNCEYVAASHRLAENDEVAFLPPLAGG